MSQSSMIAQMVKRDQATGMIRRDAGSDRLVMTYL